jgi:(2S)-methylsuccinyl-CoA dehydrogenase
MTQTTSPGLAAAAEAVELAQRLVDSACDAVRTNGGVDANQVVAYDVAHAAAAVATARATLTYGALGETEELLATAFVADVLGDLVGRVAGREAAWGTVAGWNASAADFLAARRDSRALAALARVEGPRHLGVDFELVRETFHRFAEDKVRPHAEHVHRTNGDIPE